MRKGFWIWVGLAVWAGLYAASFLVAWNTAPTGDSFLRGANRLMVFFQFQIVAGLVAIVVWYLGLAFERGTWQRWLSRAPALLAIGLVLVIVAVIVMANLRKPNPSDGVPPPRQALTEPAKPAQPVK